MSTESSDCMMHVRRNVERVGIVPVVRKSPRLGSRQINKIDRCGYLDLTRSIKQSGRPIALVQKERASKPETDWFVPLNRSWVSVDYYNLAAFAGCKPSDLKDRPSGEIAVPVQFLNNLRAASVDNLACIVVRGNSMEPEIHDGDVLLIDRSVREISGEGVFVVSLDGELLVKRIQHRSDHVVALISTNPAYKPIEVDLGVAGDNFEIIAQVVWAGRGL